MSYTLVLTEKPAPETTRDVAENIHLASLPTEAKVYLFYYTAARRNQVLEDGLRELGSKTGGNLFVAINDLSDPLYDQISQIFEIGRLPVVILTATADLASPEDEFLNAFVRLDHPSLMADSARVLALVDELFGLFIRGDVAAAASKVSWVQRSEGLRKLGLKLVEGLKNLGGFIAGRDWTLSVIEGRLEVKR